MSAPSSTTATSMAEGHSRVPVRNRAVASSSLRRWLDCSWRRPARGRCWRPARSPTSPASPPHALRARRRRVSIGHRRDAAARSCVARRVRPGPCRLLDQWNRPRHQPRRRPGLGRPPLGPVGAGRPVAGDPVALVVRLRQLGWVIGEVGTAATAELERFVRQKTALLTTYRRDGSPVDTPLSITVDGDRAYIRTFERAWKTKRIGNNPLVEVAPVDSPRPGHRPGDHRPGQAAGRRGVQVRRACWPASIPPCTASWCRWSTGLVAPRRAGRYFELTPLHS
jgi:PPOX class probable F420-dependent enzyme